MSENYGPTHWGRIKRKFHRSLRGMRSKERKHFSLSGDQDEMIEN